MTGPTADGSVRSWHAVVLGVIAQAGVGVWLLVGGADPGAGAASELVVTLLGWGLLLLAGAAAVVLLPALALLSVGRYRSVATGLLVVVAGAVLVIGHGAVVVWPLPAFLFVAALLSWRERTNAAS